MLKPFAVLCGALPLALLAAPKPIEVDYRQPAKPLTVFWNSTGFSPADIVATPEMKQVVRDLGALPERGLKYIRPHYLLNLAEARGMDSAHPTYHWAQLDQALDEITRSGLRLIFELMGFPADGSDQSVSQYDKNFQAQLSHRKTYFDDLKKPEQIERWKTFVTALAQHLEARYGREEVRTWFFETTNEPDLPHFWPFGIPAFLDYYDACSEGLKAADPALQFGGPGYASRPEIPEIFTALLDHCDTGKNRFTGETRVRIDFISFHVKDLPQAMINRELAIIDLIHSRHPKFAGKPLINDESDPIRGWATPFWWQRGPWYAAFIAQNIDLHQRLIIGPGRANYRLFSSDHAFMGDWNQRTTHTLFRDQTNAAGFVAIKKPVLTVMELIARLGTHYVPADVPAEISSHFGLIPSSDHDTLSILIYNKTAMVIGPDPRFQPGGSRKSPAESVLPVKPEPIEELALMAQQGVETQLRIRGIKGQTATLTEFRLDETHGNPHRIWVSQGKPAVLTPPQVAELRAAERPAQIRSEQINCPGGEYLLAVSSPSPSVSLIVIKPGAAAGK